MLPVFHKTAVSTEESVRMFGSDFMHEMREEMRNVHQELQMQEQKLDALSQQVEVLNAHMETIKVNMAAMELANLRFQGKVGLQLPNMVEFDARRAVPSAQAVPQAWGPVLLDPNCDPAVYSCPVAIGPIGTSPKPEKEEERLPFDPYSALLTRLESVGAEPTLPIFTQLVTLMGSEFAVPCAVIKENDPIGETPLNSQDEAEVLYYEPIAVMQWCINDMSIPLL